MERSKQRIWKFALISFGLTQIILFQSCTGFESLNSNSSSNSSLSIDKNTCQGSANPEYRPSLLTNVDLRYVLADIFPAEIVADTEILKMVKEMSDINVDKLIDKTIYAENNLGNLQSEVYILQLIDISEKIFKQYLSGSNFKNDCAGLSNGCLGYYLDSVVKPLWRRPLLSEEVATFDEIFKRSISLQEKVNLTFLVAMISPQFYLKNYLPKSADESNLVYSQYALASRLSFFLYNSVPDQELLADAESGRLAEASVLQAHVDRLLTTEPYLHRFVQHTMAQWLGIDKDLNATGSIQNDKGVSLAIKDMAQQQYLFLMDLVKNDESISEVIDGSEIYMNKSIANFLGIDTAAFSDSLQRVPASLADGVAASFLASPYFSYRTRESTEESTLVTSRGKPIAKDLLCKSIPVNEADPVAIAKALESDHILNQIEVSNIRRNNFSCLGCHKDIDKMGMGLEFVDIFGRLRSTYPDGRAIEIDFTMQDSETKEVTSLPTYLKSVSQDKRLHTCFIKTIASKVAPNYLQVSNPCASEVYELNANQGVRTYIKGLVASKLFNSAGR